MNVATLTTKLEYQKKRASYAWAKYYESIRDRLTADYTNYTRVSKACMSEIPSHIKAELLSMAEELKKQWMCPVCIEMIKPENIDITCCGHYFCKECLKSVKEQGGAECKCPICRRKIAWDK